MRVDAIAAAHPPTAAGVRLGLVAPVVPAVPAATANSGAGDVEMKVSNPMSPKAGGGSDDGSAVWVDFAKNPVAEQANPKNVTIVQDFSEGSAVWAQK